MRGKSVAGRDRVEALGPKDVPPRAYLFLAAVMAASYVAMPFVVTEVRTQPLLLAAVLLGGAGLGLGVALIQAAMSRSSRDRLSTVRLIARFTVMGAVGVGLLLAQALDITTIHGLLLGLAGVCSGAMSHAWARARRATG